MSQNMLRITDSTGDTRMPWDTENADQLAAVSFQFDQYNRKGYAAFADGRKVKAFDSLAKEVIMIGPIVAG